MHNAMTVGCGSGQYCPGSTAARNQIAAFVARAAFAGDAGIPKAGMVPGIGPYFCGIGGTSVFSDVAPDHPFCPHIHWVAAGGRSFSCDEEATYATTWCPGAPTTRGVLATILARDIAGGDDLVPASRPNPGNGRGYDCTDGQPNAFSDVTDNDSQCRFVYYIWSLNIIDGYGDGTYRSDTPVTRTRWRNFW